ncbi:major facilitator superfamily domain-containing protein [Tribonema minus]|uniref:Major facilitator superfamily domain-containing protein n=1 Tax=Tribonema minus TaxID=303371 RepID=A0A835Z7W4_9STRA|nr:major facilitator superfamily domain-containing protein [Tribonema minus]
MIRDGDTEYEPLLAPHHDDSPTQLSDQEGAAIESASAPWVLFVMTALNVINFWHRNLLYNLSAVSAPQCTELCDDVPFQPLCTVACDDGDTDCVDCATCRTAYDNGWYNLKDGACVTSAQYGLLAGFGFTVMFAAVGLFAGRMCDTMNRRLLHSGAVLMWSVATAATGLCTSYPCVLAARVFLAIGQAFNAPACYSVIDWYFPSRRSTANGVYSAGTYLGAGLSSLCILAAELVGWRRTSYIAGSTGVFMASILFHTVEQPPARAAAAAAKRNEGGGGSVPPFRALLALLANPRVVLLLVATSLRMIGTWVVASYFPDYFLRAFPAREGAYSAINGAIVAAGGVASSFAGGALADAWARRSGGAGAAAFAWVPAIGAAAGLVPTFFALYLGNFYAAMAVLALEVRAARCCRRRCRAACASAGRSPRSLLLQKANHNLIAECWLGPGMAILQREVPRDMVGFSVAVLLFCNSLASNVGPWIIAAADPGTADVRHSIFLTMALSYGGAAVAFGWLGLLLQRPLLPRSGGGGGKRGGGAAAALARRLCGRGGGSARVARGGEGGAADEGGSSGDEEEFQAARHAAPAMMRRRRHLASHLQVTHRFLRVRPTQIAAADALEERGTLLHRATAARSDASPRAVAAAAAAAAADAAAPPAGSLRGSADSRHVHL